ncbi:three-Cys-motif partner protein TcmP [Candidatus Nitrososphaera sp. FF02]|uniref:three-Cys-motif partner protein TcmP n=1 Tax=Candidatus Nitrososphaera sp. FF02 TaxID=3398226 RepID=UPI0039EA8804
MGLEFHDDAIVLSGETGTRLKSHIVGSYYSTWWNITSGGDGLGFSLPTAIVELNAGTGLNFISDTKEVILGSSGHAIELKASNPKTTKLRIALVENHPECFSRLKNVLRKRWPSIKWSERPLTEPSMDVHLIDASLPTAVDIIQSMSLGNSLFFFDPLLYTPWSEIDRVARKRLERYYQTGTEFIVFLFTSDWFRGRGELKPLPTSNDGKWSPDQQKAIEQCDELFGNQNWRKKLLTSDSIGKRMNNLVDLYKLRLHTWFRYVVALPFEPKKDQMYHLFMCSNYEDGASITKKFYVDFTKNSKYTPNNIQGYAKFIKHHPAKKMPGNSRSIEWKILWSIIQYHEEGLCDIECRGLFRIEKNQEARTQALKWLSSEGYLREIKHLTDEWKSSRPDNFYELNWEKIGTNLGIEPPPRLIPLSKPADPFRPIILIVFKDGSQVRMSQGSSLGGLTDEDGMLTNVERVEADISCEVCGTNRRVIAQDIEEVSSDEQEMGPEVFYSAKSDAVCKKCGKDMEIDIELITYAYNTDFHNYNGSNCKLV